MDCKEIELLLNDYLENRISDKLKSTFDEHCKACNNCQSLISDCKKHIILLKELESQQVPAGIYEKVYKKIEKNNKNILLSDIFGLTVFKVGLPIAAALLIVFGIYYKRSVVVPDNNPLIVQQPRTPDKTTANNSIKNPAVGENNLMIVAKEMENVENSVYSFVEQNNSAFLGGSTSGNDIDLKEKLDSKLNDAHLNNIKLNDEIKNILYNRARRIHNINLLKKRNIIADDDKGMIVILKPNYGLSKADIIMIDEENEDRKLLISLYVKTLETTDNFKTIPPQEINNKLEEMLSKVLNKLY